MLSLFSFRQLYAAYLITFFRFASFSLLICFHFADAFIIFFDDAIFAMRDDARAHEQRCRDTLRFRAAIAYHADYYFDFSDIAADAAFFICR